MSEDIPRVNNHPTTSGQAVDFEGSLIRPLRSRFRSGDTLSEAHRRHNLKALRSLVEEEEAAILAALHADLGKPPFEAYGAEIGFIKAEIDHALSNLRHWMRPQSRPTPLTHFPARSRIHFEPKGVVLIISPWNYPLQLCLDPLIGALAAGNTVVVKPSECAAKTSALLAELVARYFSPEIVGTVTGGAEITEQLLDERFNHIFFTGSARVGRVIAAKAARHLTPTTLELGGKSPCLIDRVFDLKKTARRITWGKFWNAGQTCVAPDYLLVPEEHKDKLIRAMETALSGFFGPAPSASSDYARIVNERHYERLTGLLSGVEILFGGDQNPDTRYIAPTLVDAPAPDHPLMRQEIFGPILPIITYRNLEDAYEWIDRAPDPLALYVFSERVEFQNKVLRDVHYGNGCINDTLVQFATPWLPAGGRGESGHGNYHGQFGFETFSHLKSVVKTSTALDLPIRYPPYRNKISWLRWLMG